MGRLQASQWFEHLAAASCPKLLRLHGRDVSCETNRTLGLLQAKMGLSGKMLQLQKRTEARSNQ
jgi:hypothetical protein